VTERKTAKPVDAPEFAGLLLLDDLIRDSFESASKEFIAKPKLGDWLKMLEVRAKLTTEKASNRELWKLLEEVRREVLNNGEKKTPKPQSDKPARKSARKGKQDA
jgi:hypothetical protein